MKKFKFFGLLVSFLIVPVFFSHQLWAQNLRNNPSLDEKVKKFLSDHSGQWRDLNISAADGQLLYDLIIEGNYKSALEIGTSTGHSGIWIAWAMSKTGGKLITIEYDELRHKTALQNFKEAGLSDYIDARRADAHSLVKELKGPFDFVFSDADKDWYKNYFIEIDPKLKVGGCYTTHNISDRSMGGYGRQGGGRGSGGSGDYLEYVRSLNNYETTLNRGTLISYKRAESNRK
jgi:caffeoyl-CoA O-methyltransferase